VTVDQAITNTSATGRAAKDFEHRPSDTPDKVDTEKVARVVNGIERVIRDIQGRHLSRIAR
jgi:hypothetical protein